jgi:four helix bundle protein
MRDFRELKVWAKAHALALAVYRATQRFPREESFGLTSQIRRSSASIPTNIAEGCGRDGKAEMKRFLTIAKGSASELEYQLLLARDLDYVGTAEYERLAVEIVEIKRMLTRFVQRVANESADG